MGEQIISHYTDRDFWPKFVSDLRECRQWAVVLAPFVARARARGCVAEFRRMVKRGCRVIVYMRPRGDQPGAMSVVLGGVAAELRRAGVEVRCRERMHEKVIVLDGRILWHGSLNVMSHGTSRESMLRLGSGELVAVVLADLGVRDFLPRAWSGIVAPIRAGVRGSRSGRFRVR